MELSDFYHTCSAYHCEIVNPLCIARMVSKGFGQVGKPGNGAEIYAVYQFTRMPRILQVATFLKYRDYCEKELEMENKTITMRLTESIYEKLCQLANKKDELPTETARRILRENLADISSDSADEVIVAEIVPDEEK